jgi:hypothetical protein
MSEDWRIIRGWDAYEVSNLGRVRRIRGGSNGTYPGRVLKASINPQSGYLSVEFKQKPRRQRFRVNRLVCEAFHGSPPSTDHEAAHGDGNRQNNSAGNLRWATSAENLADKKLHGTSTAQYGESNPSVKLTEDQVTAIRRSPRYWGYQADLAKRHGVSKGAITDVVQRKTWRHIGV